MAQSISIYQSQGLIVQLHLYIILIICLDVADCVGMTLFRSWAPKLVTFVTYIQYSKSYYIQSSILFQTTRTTQKEE